jgi:hypothetical protein
MDIICYQPLEKDFYEEDAEGIPLRLRYTGSLGLDNKVWLQDSGRSYCTKA